MPIVLIVDDNPIDRRMAAGVVEKYGFTARFAADGQEALEVIRRTPPDIVLIDLRMPEMDGLELLEHITSDYPTVPAIVMTAHGSEEIAVKSLLAGAVIYVPKQNLVRDLGHTLRDVLRVSLLKQAKLAENEATGTAREQTETDPQLE